MSRTRKILDAVSKPPFKEGDRVRLKGEGQVPDEVGTIEWDQGEPNAFGEYFYCVRVDDEYRHDPEDDGVREVTHDQIELIQSGLGVYPKKQSPAVKRVRDYLKSRGQDQRN